MCNANERNYASVSEYQRNTKTTVIHSDTEKSSQVLSKTTVASNSNGDGRIQNVPLKMSRRKGSSIQRLSCQKGQISENELVADSDRMPPDMKLMTTMVNLESKLDYLLELFSDKERQLEELRKENSELKLENKRLDEINRRLELNISSEENCKNLTERQTSVTNLVDTLKDLKEILQKYEREGADRQQEMNTTPSVSVSQENTNITHTEANKQLEKKELISQHFLNRRRMEYLTGLREFHKFAGKNATRIKVGDIVQVYDNTPRVKCKLAMVDELITGNDGLVRSAKIHTASNKITTRPVTKLYPLELP
jgi:uncharacterized phage infection (PIP) family protein YhgE